MALTYLVDKSAWEQLRYSRAARETFLEKYIGASIAICPVIAAELLFSARDFGEFAGWRAEYATLTWLETTDAAQQRMIDVMAALAKRGQHRSVGIADLIVAATAEAHGATVLHYDSDFERVAEITGQPHEWIVPRGAGHSR